MASFEGIRSPVPTQPSARSPKLRIYESLFLWNQGVDQVVAILRGMEKLSCADRESLQSAQVEIEEVRRRAPRRLRCRPDRTTAPRCVRRRTARYHR